MTLPRKRGGLCRRLELIGQNMAAMKEIKSWSEIPEFATEDEEREFWDTHSISAELSEDFDRPARGTMARKLRDMTLPDLDEETLRRLLELDRMRQVDPRELAIRFITERLYEEEKRAGIL
ncbi:CopG family antitoxin [soil metagenome]